MDSSAITSFIFFILSAFCVFLFFFASCVCVIRSSPFLRVYIFFLSPFFFTYSVSHTCSRRSHTHTRTRVNKETSEKATKEETRKNNKKRRRVRCLDHQTFPDPRISSATELSLHFVFCSPLLIHVKRNREREDIKVQGKKQLPEKTRSCQCFLLVDYKNKCFCR